VSAERSQKIVLGSRGSELARAQTELVEKALRAAWPKVAIEIEIIATRGDRRSDLPNESFDEKAGRKGFFTSEIERALQSGKIDVAVHSAKDLPSDMTSGLEICATLPRAAIDDVLVMKESGDFALLRRDAVIATGSVRRQHQLRWKRPDLRLVGLRGNVPMRLRKLIANDWDAIVLARAGLERLGHDLSRRCFDCEGHRLHFEPLPISEFLPAGGQGVIAIQIRTEDEITKRLVSAINHRETLACLRAEREFLRLLQGDCNCPVSVLAMVEHDEMTVRAQVFATINEPPKTGNICLSLRTQEPEKISAALYASMYGQR